MKRQKYLFIGVFLILSVILFINLVLCYGVEEGIINNIYLINISKYLLWFFKFPYHFIFLNITNTVLYFGGYFVNIFIYSLIMLLAGNIFIRYKNK